MSFAMSDSVSEVASRSISSVMLRNRSKLVAMVMVDDGYLS